MTCSHYLQLIYGIMCSKGFIKTKYNFAGDSDDEYDLFYDIPDDYLGQPVETCSFEKHGFPKENDQEMIIGFSVDKILKSKTKSRGVDYATIDYSTLKKLKKYDKFFFENLNQISSETKNAPKIYSVMGGCSCCS